MKNSLFLTIFSVVFALFSFNGHAQTEWQLISAQEYHHMKSGPEKTKRIRQLEEAGWYHQDTFFDMQGKPVESPKVDLSPYVDDKGETVYLVTDVSPEFPGGQEVLSDYVLNAFSENILTRPGESPQNQVRIKFTVEKDGRITEVAPTQTHPNWISNEVLQICLQSVEEMPKWSPGNYKDKPVKVKLMIEFSLRK